MRVLTILDQWGDGTGATIYFYGSRVREDYTPESDFDIFVRWPTEPTDRLVQWWTRENESQFQSLSDMLGGLAEVLDPDDKPMQEKIMSAPKVKTVGCAVAVHLPRRKPVSNEPWRQSPEDEDDE